MSSTSELERQKQAREIDAISQRALEFYEANGMIEKLEDVLNAAFNEQPKDLFGHFVSLLRKMVSFIHQPHKSANCWLSLILAWLTCNLVKP